MPDHNMPRPPPLPEASGRMHHEPDDMEEMRDAMGRLQGMEKGAFLSGAPAEYSVELVQTAAAMCRGKDIDSELLEGAKKFLLSVFSAYTTETPKKHT